MKKIILSVLLISISANAGLSLKMLSRYGESKVSRDGMEELLSEATQKDVNITYKRSADGKFFKPEDAPISSIERVVTTNGGKSGSVNQSYIDTDGSVVKLRFDFPESTVTPSSMKIWGSDNIGVGETYSAYMRSWATKNTVMLKRDFLTFGDKKIEVTEQFGFVRESDYSLRAVKVRENVNSPEGLKMSASLSGSSNQLSIHMVMPQDGTKKAITYTQNLQAPFPVIDFHISSNGRRITVRGEHGDEIQYSVEPYTFSDGTTQNQRFGKALVSNENHLKIEKIASSKNAAAKGRNVVSVTRTAGRQETSGAVRGMKMDVEN